jgi:hypothetical protein
MRVVFQFNLWLKDFKKKINRKESRTKEEEELWNQLQQNRNISRKTLEE